MCILSSGKMLGPDFSTKLTAPDWFQNSFQAQLDAWLTPEAVPYFKEQVSASTVPLHQKQIIFIFYKYKL